jgi:hypothetical protein
VVRAIALNPLFWLLRRPPAEDSCYHRAGGNTAIRALKSVEGMDKLGPAYLMARERAAEKVNTLTIGLMLLFMEVMVGCIIRD